MNSLFAHFVFPKNHYPSVISIFVSAAFGKTVLVRGRVERRRDRPADVLRDQRGHSVGVDLDVPGPGRARRSLAAADNRVAESARKSR